MIYYLLVLLTAPLGTGQLFSNQQYQKHCGRGTRQTLVLSAGAALVTIAAMLAYNLICGISVRFTLFSAAFALIASVINILFIYAGIRAFERANLSMVSVSSSAGSMLLPSLFGMCVLREAVTVQKVAGIALIVAALCATARAGRDLGKTLRYCAAVFLLNGSMGILTKLHQIHPERNVDSGSYLILKSASVVLLALLLLTLMPREKFSLSRGAALAIGGYGLCYCANSLIGLIANIHLPASVQYPLHTGGAIVFSTLVSALRKEKIVPSGYFAAAAAFAATLILAL